MEKLSFRCTREMNGDKAYAEGDTRQLSAVDAAHLVRSGALVPNTAASIKAMAEMFGTEPRKQTETIVQETAKDDAPNNKAMGNAPGNKAAGSGRKGASGGNSAAAPAGSAAAPTPPAPPVAPAVPNVGTDGGAPATPPPVDQGGGDGSAPAAMTTGDAGPPVAAAVTPPPARAKRR